MAHKFNPEHLERLVSPEREKEIDPESLLREAGLKTGDVFADIGAGPGFFTIPAARIVGAHSIAFAVDTQADMLIHLRDKRNPPDNVVLMKSEEYEVPLNGSEADFVLLAYMLHETPDKPRFLKEVNRILRPGGTLLVIDWEKIKEEKGPPEEERVTPEEAAAFLSEAGFSGFQGSSLNPSHYMIKARKA